MADFGYKIKGAFVGSYANTIIGTNFSPGGAGTAQSITAYIEEKDVGKKIKFGIYKESDASLVGYTEEWGVTEGWDGWKTLNIVWGGTIEDTDYYLVIWQEGTNRYFYNSLTNVRAYMNETYGPTWPDPWDQTEWETKTHSIYCTYGEEEEGPPSLNLNNLSLSEILRLIKDNDTDIDCNPVGRSIAETLQYVARGIGINISGMSVVEIIRAFNDYYA